MNWIEEYPGSELMDTMKQHSHSKYWQDELCEIPTSKGLTIQVLGVPGQLVDQMEIEISSK